MHRDSQTRYLPLRERPENPGHWVIAVSVLIRAVVLDRIPVDDPAVARILDLLLPVVDAEIAAEAEDDSDFPETHGPLFLLGTCALVEATWAIMGSTPLDQALALMRARIGDALAAVEGTALPDGKVMAEALIRAFADEYECTQPHDVRTLDRLGPAASGGPLTDLIQAKDAAPEHALRLGLVALAALGPGANRCRLRCRALGPAISSRNRRRGP